MLNNNLFVIPPLSVFDSQQEGCPPEQRSYGLYNYLRPGLIPHIKRQRFETALKLARPYFGPNAAIDVGCGDGVFLPSLSRYFQNVAAIDRYDHVLHTAQQLVEVAPLKNVTLLNNCDMDFEQVGEQLGRNFRVAFMLETLEHVGSLPNLYESKADFLDGVFTLLQPEGVIIISVPRMVGLLFFIKYLMQWSLRLPTEPMQWREVFRSAFLRDTRNLEPLWNGSHVGFNHLKLTEVLRSRFHLVECRGGLTSVFYVIARMPTSRTNK